MIRTYHAALALAAALSGGLGLSATASAAAKKSCALYGGDATMVGEDAAKFMAGAALKNSISGAGATAAGEVKMTCSGTGLVTCQARQRACK
jgi:hypothetical protein